MADKIVFVIISLYCCSKIIEVESKNESGCWADVSHGSDNVVQGINLRCVNKVSGGTLIKETMTGANVLGENYTVSNSPHPITAFHLTIRGNVTIEENALSEFSNISSMELDCVGGGCNLHISSNDVKHIKLLEKIKSNGVSFTQNIIELIRSSKSLVNLEVYDSGLRSIKTRMFGDLPILSDLRLTSNGIEEIEKGAFDGLPNLGAVRLNMNNLSHLPDGLFDKAKALNYVFLSSNKLKTLNKSVCQGMKNVSSLTIGANEFTYFEPEAVSESTLFALVPAKNK